MPSVCGLVRCVLNQRDPWVFRSDARSEVCLVEEEKRSRGGYEGFLGEGEDKGMIRGNRFEEIRCSLFSSPRPPLQQVNRNCKAKLRRATKHDHVNNTAPNTTANSRDGG